KFLKALELYEEILNNSQHTPNDKALNAEEQALLIPFKIVLPNYPRPLFEYESYTTSIRFYLNNGIQNWLENEGYNVEEYKDELANTIGCTLIVMFLRASKSLKCLEL
ncbi:800_t:CDS:2, partial [Ambispora leptoticha]